MFIATAPGAAPPACSCNRAGCNSRGRPRTKKKEHLNARTPSLLAPFKIGVACRF